MSRVSSRSPSRAPRRSRSSIRQYASEITAGAEASFLDGADWAYTAGIVAVLLGAVVVFFLFPKRDEEEQLLARYHAEDTAARPDAQQTGESGRLQPEGA